MLNLIEYLVKADFFEVQSKEMLLNHSLKRLRGTICTIFFIIGEQHN